MSTAKVILPTLPVLVPLFAGIATLFAYRAVPLQRALGALALLLNLAGALLALRATAGGGLLVTQAGNWPAPFGITVAIDLLGAGMLTVTAVVALAAWVYITSHAPRVAAGYFHPLYQLLVLGVNWAFVTGDIFNLFVSFEVMLLASYVLLVIGTSRRQMRQAYKYVLLNVFASTVFVAACGWIYGNLGTLNIAELAHLSRSGAITPGAAVAIAAVAFVFAAKAAVFPLWFWLPDSYPALPSGLGALYAALLTKVGIYALLRIVLMSFGQAQVVADAIGPAMLLAAGATMLVGGLGMAGAASLRVMLNCGILVGVGYMLVGPAFALTAEADSPAAGTAMTGAVFYMLQHMLVIAGLLLCGDVVERYRGTDDLRRLGNVLAQDGWLALVFFVGAMSLIGLPPTSGFAGKLLLVRAGFERGDAWGWALSLLILLSSVLVLVALGRAWCAIFWSPSTSNSEEPAPAARETPARRATLLFPAATLTALALAMGLLASPVGRLAAAAGRLATDPAPYITAVLGGAVDPAPLPQSPALRAEGADR